MVVVLILQVVVRQGLATSPAATGGVGVRRAVSAAAALPAISAAVVVATLAATISAVVVLLPDLATDPAGIGVRRAVGAAIALPAVPATFVVLILMILQVVLQGLGTPATATTVALDPRLGSTIGVLRRAGGAAYVPPAAIIDVRRRRAASRAADHEPDKVFIAVVLT